MFAADVAVRRVATEWSGPRQDRAGSAGGDERDVDSRQLVGCGAAYLTDGFGDQVEAVDVALTDQAPVRVARQSAAGREVAVGDEVLRIAERAEAERFELHEQDRCERVVDHRE